MLHTRTPRDVPDHNVDHRGTDRQAQDKPSRPALPLRPEQRGRSVFATYPISIQEGRLVVEPKQANSSSLRQYGLHPHPARRQVQQYKLQYRICPHRGFTPRGRRLRFRSVLTFVKCNKNKKNSASAQNIIVAFYREYSRYRYLYFTTGKLSSKKSDNLLSCIY